MQVHIIPPAPVHRATVLPRVQTLGDTKAGRNLAARLGDAAATFEIIKGRAVQVVAVDGSPIDGMDQR